MALRRGVALGGGGHRVPAAARPARGDRGAGHARAHPGAVRPAGDAPGPGGRAPARVPARDARGWCTRRTPPGSSARGTPSWAPRCAARGATTCARPRRWSATAATCSRASPPWRRAARSSSGPRRRPTRCCPSWPATRACACSWPPASPRTSGASAPSAGGFWLPECAYVPGLERELADHGVRATCVDQTAVHGYGAPEHLEPVLTPGGVVAAPIDWASVAARVERRDRLPRPPRLPRLPPAHGARPAPVEQRRRAVLPRAGRGAGPRTRARLRRALHREARRLRRRARPPRPAHLRAGHRAARPLVVRGPDLAARRVRRGVGPGPAAGHRERGARARSSRWSASPRSRAGARARTSRPGTPRRWPRWPSRPAAPSCARSPPRRAAPTRPTRSRAPPASCWRCSPATGPSR